VRGGRRIIGVVLGSPSAAARTVITRGLLDEGLSGAANPIGNLRTLRADAPVPGADLRRFKCGRQGPAAQDTIAIGGDLKGSGPSRLPR
jgi:D-alanyl-D-alanine carboxypeptidase